MLPRIDPTGADPHPAGGAVRVRSRRDAASPGVQSIGVAIDVGDVGGGVHGHVEVRSTMTATP